MLREIRFGKLILERACEEGAEDGFLSRVEVDLACDQRGGGDG